ncbi:glycerophosphodiester phosphodiesterase [Azohydromonas sediminis]|uniref:glycerophosphodiester phosphodiesterase n=1 Tax=Azohydromonas sediminis TaxID=2259674 RepID=UPI000E65CC34|nr:glycerophosphodiester phosphodiesterase [Azohydromonas sediminis]
MTAWPYPRWIAHRGAGTLAPENTLAALREGWRHGFRAFECDAKLSADGVPFLLHDDTLERTTDGRGPAEALNWAELSRLDAGGWLAPAWAGEPPATLQAVAAFVRANGCALNIELKPGPGRARATGEAVAALAARWWAGAAVPPLLSSFDADALAAARSAAPQLPRALLLEALADRWLGQAQRLDCAAVVVEHTALGAEAVVHARRAGLRVLAYTVNEPGDARRLLDLGIDGLITDAVDRFDPAS